MQQFEVRTGGVTNKNSFKIKRLENLGDDLMHYQRMFSKNGEGFQETLRMLQRTGAALTNEQMEASKQYTKMTAILGLMGQGMQNNFLEGFMKSMEGAPDFTENAKLFMNTTKELGLAVGGLVNAVSSAVDWFNKLNPENKHEQLHSSGLFYEDSMVGSMYRWGASMLGLPELPGGESSKDLPSWAGQDQAYTGTYSPNTDLLRESLNPVGTPPINSPVYTVNPTFNVSLTQEVPVTIQSDVSRLSDYIDFNAKASSDSFMQSLTLQTLSGQSNSN